MKVRFEPMPGKVVVRLIEEGNSVHLKESGLYLVSRTAGVDQANYGMVEETYEAFIDPADGAETEPFLKKGDHILFGKFSGITLRVGNERFLALRESEVLTKIIFEEEDDPGVPVEAAGLLPADYDVVSATTKRIRQFEEQHGV